MKKILTLTILLLCLHNLFAQTIQDSVFNNVILIKYTDVTTNGFHFLIDIPIKPQKEPTVIFNNDFRIPAKLFFSRKSFLHEQNELILITTDWVFEKKNREREKKEGIHIKAYKNKIYHIKRSNSGYEVDSLSIVLHDPRKPIKINFKNPELKEKEIKCFFKECYGSSCCPRDEDWEFRRMRDKMKKDFYENHNANVYKDFYRQVLGRESEHCDYFTLSDLTNEQKIKFLFPPKIYAETDDVQQDFFVIISPSIINTENMKHQNPPQKQR